MGIPVKLQVFEGPLDLLLHLIEKNKVDIYDIPIVEITEQYLDYIRQMQTEDMNVMSEFLLMAATLLDIKCRMLLPREVNEEGEEEDPRAELVEKLLEYNIPFRMKDNVPNLYEHWIAKDIIAYMKIAMGSRYRKDFLKIMNRPKRYISRDSLDEETVAFDVWEWFYEDKPWVAERIQRLEYDIKMLSTMSPYAAINYIRRGIGYDEFCVEYADYRRMNVEDLYEVLEELQNSAKGFDTYNDWFEHIENYTAELEKIYRQQNQNPESVALATLHSSKGLEYDNVYIIDVNEGIMPYKKAVLDNEVEEERRMFYVGMTRAKKKLHLYSIEQLNHKNTDISRFIRESQKK
mgnify:CR=1 FL=1